MNLERLKPQRLSTLLWRYRDLLFDILWSTAPYFLLTSVGCSQRLALWLGAAGAGLRMLYALVRQRRIDGLAVFLLSTYVISIGAALLTGDHRFLLAKDSATTAQVGLTLLFTCVAGRPALFLIAKRLHAPDPAQAQRWDHLWSTQPAYRRTYILQSLVWGTALLLEAALRVLAVYTLPAAAVVALSYPFQGTVIGLLLAWRWYYFRRPRQRYWMQLLREPTGPLSSRDAGDALDLLRRDDGPQDEAADHGEHEQLTDVGGQADREKVDGGNAEGGLGEQGDAPDQGDSEPAGPQVAGAGGLEALVLVVEHGAGHCARDGIERGG
ncbi:VC0807 family protein [Nocardia terpenica]|uniref:DUF3159 domain-containing protein n=1 Tax=Nocardia terpenica TaxID=455432 RepID=A0A291RMM5_9NOCA|nr:VC0807 family protein [Nocardia terpenica]ATL68342.1 hypothetical protein CRH09_21325 [Nocardia terpenica]